MICRSSSLNLSGLQYFEAVVNRFTRYVIEYKIFCKKNKLFVMFGGKLGVLYTSLTLQKKFYQNATAAEPQKSGIITAISIRNPRNRHCKSCNLTQKYMKTYIIPLPQRPLQAPLQGSPPPFHSNKRNLQQKYEEPHCNNHNLTQK